MDYLSITVQTVYFNNIGILHIFINYNISIIDLKQINLLHKCEDGKLTIKLKYSNNNFYSFSIFHSSSMKVKLDNTKIINYKPGVLLLRYQTTNNLIKNETVFDMINEMTILDCFNYLSNEHKFSEILCKNCDNIILENNQNNQDIKQNEENNTNSYKFKLINNFNYDYIENLEVLSCHEGDIENIIPNLSNKLKVL
jgi:hypothetical protein